MQDASVKAALEAVRQSEPQTIEEQIRFCEVPAPPFKETARAADLKQLFEGARAAATCESIGPATCSATGPGPRRVRGSWSPRTSIPCFPKEPTSR